MVTPYKPLLLLLAGIAMAEVDWTTQCNRCKCTWANGKKTADCTNVGLSSIPTDLSDAIREIDFSNNNLYELRMNEFINANLRDVHKLKFQNCSIQALQVTSFKGLQLLIELDLSRNKVPNLPKEIFKDNVKLRILILSHNDIKTLEDGLFYNMMYLQKLLLDHNQIEVITNNTFKALPALHHIGLAYNRIKRITFDLVQIIPRLNSLSVEGNPWVCDCYLEEFKNRSITKNLITVETVCAEPSYLKGTAWSLSTTFSCRPQILAPPPETRIEATSSNVTLYCKVTGDPQPDITWSVNGRIIDRDPRLSKQKFETFKQRIGPYTWNNLTIINVNYRDRGEYKCEAVNPGGQDERNITLLVSASGVIGGGSSAFGGSLSWIIGLSASLAVIIIIIFILICCYCKRSRNRLDSKRGNADSSNSEEYIHMRGQPEMKKSLITEVNPVMKPPRVAVPPSCHSGGTEVSDVKRNLLDSDSFFDGDDESRSVDMGPASLKSQMIHDPHYQFINHPYPPDLLTFPPITNQISPAGSSASTVADTTRLPPHHGPQSPMHSPLYDTLSLYRTLPYSRSHAPFVGPARIPKQGQGYVTIPRRPRQSWSSEPPSSSDFAVEPLYDNLGLRTTVDGSSALSLNKLGEVATTPRSIRMFPMSPTNCDPIAEHETPVSAATLPRNMNSQLSPRNTNWAKANAEVLKSPEKRNSITSLPSPDGKTTKIPPRPPPKPKKRISTGPLFEDEGEDGTEV